MDFIDLKSQYRRIQPQVNERIQAVLVDTGALADQEALIERLAAEAVDALDTADIADEARKELTHLAHFVAWREH